MTGVSKLAPRADRLAEVTHIGPAAVTIYHYDACGDRLADESAPYSSADETPNAAGD